MTGRLASAAANRGSTCGVGGAFPPHREPPANLYFAVRVGARKFPWPQTAAVGGPERPQCPPSPRNGAGRQADCHGPAKGGQYVTTSFMNAVRQVGIKQCEGGAT